jgi:hypothetical protein
MTSFVIERGREPTLRAPTNLTWRPTAALATPIPPWRLGFETGGYSNTAFSIRALYDYDYDGDGAPEAIVERAEWAPQNSGSGSVHHTIFTVRDGAVHEYAPSHEFTHVTLVTDADNDGRPDLLLPSPWHIETVCGVPRASHDGPPLLAHALPDGRFSTTDDVARA